MKNIVEETKDKENYATKTGCYTVGKRTKGSQCAPGKTAAVTRRGIYREERQEAGKGQTSFPATYSHEKKRLS
jgi:hypothetical protein